MYSSDESDDEETLRTQSHLYSNAVAGLKPALDDIFAEVQANIPVIGSDSESEVNSDEEPLVFNRSGDLTSLAPSEHLSLAFKEAYKALESESESQENKDKAVQSCSSTSTDSGVSISDSNVSYNVDVSKSCSEDGISSVSPYQGRASQTTYQETPQSLSTDTTDYSAQTDTRNEMKNQPNDSVALNFSRLANIDFASLMDQVNEVRVPLWPDTNPLENDTNNNQDPDSDTDRDSFSSDELMRQLIDLSQKQQDEAQTICQGVASCSINTVTKDLHQSTRTIDSGIQTGDLYNDAGVMATQSTASIGVSASFDPSSHEAGTQSQRSIAGPQERGTIFIDLRNQKTEPQKKEGSTVSSSIQRILGIQDVDSSSSSSEDENDMELWHEQRRRIKQGIAEQNQVQRTKQDKTPNLDKRFHRSTNKQATDTIKKSSSLRDSNHKKEVGLKVDQTIPATPDEEKKSTVIEEKKAQKSKGNKKVEAKAPNEYILVNKHVSPTETVAEFVLIPSREFDKLNARPQEVNKESSGQPEKESKRQNTKNAWVEIQVQEQKSPHKNKLVTHERRPVGTLEEKSPKPVDKPVKPEPSYTKSTSTELSQKTKGSITTQDSKEVKKKDIKPSKKQLEQLKILNEKIKAKKVRVQQRLDSVKREREARTVGGHVCIAASQTPIVYDMDTSYEPIPMSLPENFASKHYLLLTVTMPACGELSVGGNKASNSKGNNKTTQTGSDGHAYNTLIAWLLSLVPVPENTPYRDFAALCESPFYVVGLQQTWHEGELSVKVGICSRDNFQPSRTKQGGRGNAFQSSVSKFLRTNTLSSVMAKLSNYPGIVMDMPVSNKNLSSLLTINSDPQAMIRVFRAEPGFYWKTLEVEDTVDVHSSNIDYCGPDISNTMMLVQHEAFHDPSCMFDILNRVWSEGLDLAGIRLLYTNDIPIEERPTGLDQSTSNVFPREGPVLALAIRGPDALLRWLEVVGPNDVWLARRTNPNSLRVIYSNEDKEDHLFYCPRHANRANVELSRWFGGRVPSGDSLNIGNDDVIVQRARSGSRGRKEEQIPTSALHTALPSPPSTLVATTESLVVMVASPLILPKCLGVILCICFSRGFTLHGIRRIRFHPPQFKDSIRDTLGLSTAQLSVFCPLKTYTGDLSESLSFTFEPDDNCPFSVASTMICLRKENGVHNITSLVKALTKELAHWIYLPNDVLDVISRSQMCFAVAPFSEHIADVLGNKMKQIPNSNIYAAASLSHSFYSNPELEQVCVLTLLKEKATKQCHHIIDCLTLNSPLLTATTYEEDKQDYCGLELLGVKLVSSMTLHQAKEFTPYEIGDKLWQSSLKPLTSGPALICALRGINAFERLREFVHSFYGCSPRKRPQQSKDGACPDMFMSPTPEIAYRQLTAIFFEHELYADHSKRTNQHHIPKTRREITGADSKNVSTNPKQKGKKAGRSSSPSGRGHGGHTLLPDDIPIISSLLAGPCLLNTVCVIKPDAVPRHMGKVLKRLSREGFVVVNMRMVMFTDGDAMAMVSRDWDCFEADRSTHASHLISGPCLVLSLQRENAVGKLLEVLGPGSPDECRHESQFYLRGSYGTSKIRNALYGSCSYEDAVKDTKLLFPQGVCCSPTVELRAEGIPCLASDKVFNVDSHRTLVDVPEDLDSSPNQDQEFTTLLPPSLLEINCVLLLPNLIKDQGGPSSVKLTPGFIDVIDGLVTAGGQPLGVRMVRLNDKQAAHCARLYSDSIPPDIKPHHLAAQISQGPCIVIAILRDGAVTSFETLLGNPIKSNSLATRYGRYILAAKSFKKARSLLECFFDRLTPNKKSLIESNQ